MTYHDNYLNESGKDDFLYALILDGMAYKNCYNLVDFMYEFGYEEEKQVLFDISLYVGLFSLTSSEV